MRAGRAGARRAALGGAVKHERVEDAGMQVERDVQEQLLAEAWQSEREREGNSAVLNPRPCTLHAQGEVNTAFAGGPCF